MLIQLDPLVVGSTRTKNGHETGLQKADVDATALEVQLSTSSIRHGTREGQPRPKRGEIEPPIPSRLEEMRCLDRGILHDGAAGDGSRSRTPRAAARAAEAAATKQQQQQQLQLATLEAAITVMAHVAWTCHPYLTYRCCKMHCLMQASVGNRAIYSEVSLRERT